MEVELKLRIHPDDVQDFKAHASLARFALSPPLEQDQTAIYFDSPDHELRQNLAGLRVRQAGKVWTQTLKAGGGVMSGLHRRHEWESVVTGPEPDLYALRKLIDLRGAWKDLVSSPTFAARLAPVFTTTIHRTTWQLRLPEGTEVECVLDEGRIVSGERSTAVSEIELELVSGSVSQLYDFALELLGTLRLYIENQSKAERGYALGRESRPVAAKAQALALSKKMTIEQAFEAITGNCLQQVQANAIGVARSNDIESLHQMRVGIRRLRSALGLFQEVISVPGELQDELNWLFEQISAARDWDVLATKTLEKMAADGLADIVEDIRQAALDRAAGLHQLAAEAVGSPRYTRFVLMFARWLHGREWRLSLPAVKGKGAKRQLKAFSNEMLEHDKRRLSKRGEHFEQADAQGRHRVRVAAKKTRYNAEFFQSLYPPGKTKEYVTALSALQDELGWLNDLSVGERLLSELEADRSELAGVSNFIRGYLSGRAASEQREVNKLWKKFKSKLPQK